MGTKQATSKQMHMEFFPRMSQGSAIHTDLHLAFLVVFPNPSCFHFLYCFDLSFSSTEKSSLYSPAVVCSSHKQDFWVCLAFVQTALILFLLLSDQVEISVCAHLIKGSTITQSKSLKNSLSPLSGLILILTIYHLSTYSMAFHFFFNSVTR